MSTFEVVVNDPGMATAHRVTVEAPGPLSAQLLAAREAILLDRFGCGAGGTVPDGEDPATYEMPLELRQEQADVGEIIESVAQWCDAPVIVNPEG